MTQPVHPLSKEELREVVREAISESFLSIGMDPSDLVSLQKDMAYIRTLRLAKERMSMRALGTIVTILITGAFAGLVVYLTGQTPR